MITKEMLTGITDAELAQLGEWTQAEAAARKERSKQDAIAKIRELAAGTGLSVSIGGMRGRPKKTVRSAKRALSS
jgi:hypothetical protein